MMNPIWRRCVNWLARGVTGGLTPRRSPSKKPLRRKPSCRVWLEGLDDRLAPAAGLTAGNQALLQSYGQLPISFEANAGQTDAQVQYLAHGSGYALFLTSTGAVLDLRRSGFQPDRLSQTESLINQIGNLSNGVPPGQVENLTYENVALAMNLVGANPQATVTGQDQQPGTSNYFIGNDPSQWHTGIANYGQVAYLPILSQFLLFPCFALRTCYYRQKM